VKTFSVYLVVGVAIIVGQTTVLTLPLFQGMFYDLLIPMVVFIRLNLAVKRGAALVLLVGFVMDLFSGGPFGLYLTVYLWIFIGVQAVSNYFNVQGNLFRSILIAICVLLENVMFCIFSVFPGELIPVLTPRIGSVVWQAVFAAITGTTIVIVLERLHRRIEALQHEAGKSRQDFVLL
jgi:rod shape-determining protein MreD